MTPLLYLLRLLVVLLVGQKIQSASSYVVNVHVPSPRSICRGNFVRDLSVSKHPYERDSMLSHLASSLNKSAILFSLVASLTLVVPPLPNANAYVNKISAEYDDKPKRHGPQPTDLGVAIRKDILGDEYLGLKHCGNAPNCFCSTDSLEDDPDHSISAWTWPAKFTSKEQAFQDLYEAISKGYVPGQGNIDGGGFEIQKFNPEKGYLYIIFESLKYGYRDDVEFAWIPQEEQSTNISNNMIQVRSSSRVGYLDYGVNAKRLNFISQLLQKRGWTAPGVAFQTHSRYVLENGL
jgi:uncharacterized protein (DUF1499 family)